MYEVMCLKSANLLAWYDTWEELVAAVKKIEKEDREDIGIARVDVGYTRIEWSEIDEQM